ncbi:MAG: tetratricopeptide repeat protein [Lachnospiraceae bacterium]|jgi:tetratricopeptide (TPR) repeat protein
MMIIRKKTIRNISLLLTGAMLCFAGCGKNDEVSHYESGAEALEAGSYEEAIGDFELSVAEEENLVESYRGEGIAYLRLGNYEEASASFEKALSAMEGKKKDRALETDILFYQASALYKAQDLEGSKACCDQILELGFHKEACFIRGSIYLEQDDYENAQKDFARMLDGSKEYRDYLNVYRVYEKKDMTGDGDAFLEKALEISYKDADDYFERGRIYYYLEDYEHAKEALVTAMNDGNKEAALFLGKVYAGLDDIGNARAMYQQYMTDNGESAKSYNGLAYCDIVEGNYDDALNNIILGLTMAEGDDRQSLLFNEIVAYEGKLDFETARTKAEQYLASYPEDTAAQKEYEFLQSR